MRGGARVASVVPRMTQLLQSHLAGAWHDGQGDPIDLYNPATEAVVAQTKSAGGFAEALGYARDVGGPALRKLGWQERGKRLKAMAKLLHEHREALISIAVANGGNTRGDAKFDIDGATGVLATYAFLSKELGDKPWLLRGEATEIMRGSKIRTQDVWVPRHGAAIHINAFNFPAWGMVGKLAVAFLAGMPTVSKPATSSAALAERIAHILLDSDLLPPGALSLISGPVGDLLDHVAPQDVVAFTGSADTGARIRGHEAVMRQGVRVNVEADSLNAAIIGPDVEPGSELFDLVIRDAATEITQKAGQKCTATRRILVPTERLEAVRDALVDRLSAIADKTGDPSDKDVRMGPLATARQLADARAGVAALSKAAERIFGNPERSSFVGVDDGKGYFLEPILLQATEAAAKDPDAPFHKVEVFGPVSTLLPYDGTVDSARTIVGAGHGSLVSTVYTDDRKLLGEAIAELAPYLGRLVVANEKVAGASVSPGCVFAVCNHGGPGRAGGGAELGGVEGLQLYMQRTSIQGGASQIAKVL